MHLQQLHLRSSLSAFVARGAATFIAINVTTAGFQADGDALIEIIRFSGSLSNWLRCCIAPVAYSADVEQSSLLLEQQTEGATLLSIDRIGIVTWVHSINRC